MNKPNCFRGNASIVLALVIGATALQVPAQTATPSSTPAQAFQDGKRDAQQLRGNATSLIQGQGNTVVPGYTDQPREATLFQGGNGQLGLPATTKIEDCASTTDPSVATSSTTATPSTSTSSAAAQECNAINFLQKNPSTRPAFVIDPKTDPVIRGSIATLRDAASVAGTVGGSYSGCSTRTVTTPGPTTTELCQRSTQLANFPCEKTLNVIVTSLGSCVPGEWYASALIGNYYADGPRFSGVQAAAHCEFSSNLTLILRGATYNDAWGAAEIRVDAASGTPVTGESVPILYPNIGGADHHYGHYHTHSRYEGGSCTGDACQYRFSGGNMETTTSCPAGWLLSGQVDATDAPLCYEPNTFELQPATVTTTYVPRYQGGFLFQRAHLIYSTEDRWDSTCTAYEARLP